MTISICLYHGVDHDGECSAAIYRLWKEQHHDPRVKNLSIHQMTMKTTSENLENSIDVYAEGPSTVHETIYFVPVDYDDRGTRIVDVLVSRADKIDELYVLDYGFDADRTSKLQKHIKRYVWLDHHATSMKTESVLSKLPDGRRDPKSAACELTWNFLYADKWMPPVVHLLGRYDVWDHSDISVVPFEYGLRIHETYPTAYIWDPLIAQKRPVDIHQIINDGSAIVRYEKSEAQKVVSNHGIDIKLGDIDAVAINWSSLPVVGMFDRIEGDYSFAILFYLRADGKWKYSMRRIAETVNLEPLAKYFGGGGHPGAASFVDWRAPDVIFSVMSGMESEVILPRHAV